MQTIFYKNYTTPSIRQPYHEALEAAINGLTIIPLARKAKAPCRGFDNFEAHATIDPEQILHWEKELPGRNYAIWNTPADRIFEVDSDLHDNGTVNWRNFEAQHAPLPRTPLVWSGSGSGASHRYFRAPANIELPYLVRLLPGVQILGPRHYVVCPGSIHNKTHQPYRWDSQQNLQSLSIPEAPHWFVDLILKEHQRQTKKSPHRQRVGPVLAGRVSPDDRQNPNPFFQEDRSNHKSTQVIQPRKENKQNTCVDSPRRHHYAQHLFTRFHQEQHTRDPLQEALGIAPGTADGARCPCPLHPGDPYQASWHEGHGVYGQRGMYCFADGVFYSALDLFYRQRCPKGLLTAGHTKPIPKPSLCVLTALLLMELNLLTVEELELDHIPPDLPDDARRLAETLLLVKRARSATREAEAPMPIGPGLYCDWLGWTDYRFDQARFTLQTLAPDFLQRAEDYQTPIGKTNPRYKLWTIATRAVKRLALAGQQVLEALAQKFTLIRPYPLDDWGDPECQGCGISPEQAAWIPVALGWQCPSCGHIDKRDGPPQRLGPAGGAVCTIA